MWIYASVLTIVGLFALLSLSLPSAAQSVRTILLAAAVVILCVFIGLRDRVGADWDTYETIFDMYAQTDVNSVLTTVPIEPAYAVLNYGSTLVGGGIYVVNFVCAAIMIAGLVRFAYLVEIDALLALFVAAPYVLFAVGMGYTRQAVAIGLGSAALGYWVREKPKRFCLTVILAMCFHYSAVFLFLLVWMKNWRRVLIAIPVALVGGYLLVMAFYQQYFMLYVQNTQDLHSNGVWFRLAIILLGVSLATLQIKHWRQEPRLFRLIVSGSALAVALIPLAIVASTLADRICLYLFFIYLVAVARAIRLSRFELRSATLAGIYVTTYASFFTWFVLSPYAANSWIPYHSILLGRIGGR